MTAGKRRTLLIVALALPALMLGTAEAQRQFPTFERPTFQRPTFNPPTFNPPTFERPTPPTFNPPTFNPPTFNPPTFNPPPRPTINIPRIVRTWSCSRCSAGLGEGNFPPAQCPSCGARIINGVGGPVNNAPGQSSVQTNAIEKLIESAPFPLLKCLYFSGAFVGLVLMIYGILTAIKCGLFDLLPSLRKG